MRKRLFAGAMILAVCVSVGGCIASIMVLENPEWRQGVLLADVAPDMLEKHTVGDVVVLPGAWFRDNSMAEIKLVVGFHSVSSTSVISIKTLIVSIAGKKLDYGEPISPTKATDWEPTMPAPFPYLCETRVLTVRPPPGEMPKSRLDVSLVAVVREERGKETEKTIEAYFLPEKRSWLFGEFPLPR